MNIKKQSTRKEDEVDLYYRVKRELETSEENKTNELKELLIRQNNEIKLLKEELEEVKSQNKTLKDFRSLAPLTGILNLLNLKQDHVLELLVREIVHDGLKAYSSSISDFRLPL